MILQNLFKGNKVNQQMQHANMLSGYSPIFSQYGEDVFASDVVQMCIDVIATECSKLLPKHIRTDNDGMQSTVKSSINRLFKFAPNEIMTTSEFLEKTIWLLYLNQNAFIYPMYEVRQGANGNSYRYYTGYYPLNPKIVEFQQDQNKVMYVQMQFGNGSQFTLKYEDVIHLRKRFSINDIMGGGADGQPDNAALLKVLKINDTVLQGLDKAIKTTLSVRGIVNINTMTDTPKQREELKKFEEKIQSGESGIVPMDLKSEYVDIKPNPKIVDKDTLEFLEGKVLKNYGVSVPILTGDFTDDQYQAFYEKTLEPLVIGFGQAFSKATFTNRELELGNEIVFYQKNMMYLSTKSKLDFLKTAGEQGLLSDNQKLAILGYPPIPGGDKRTQSLNYIDINLANSYQMSKNNSQGGNTNE